jgi:hypothetical protein
MSLSISRSSINKPDFDTAELCRLRENSEERMFVEGYDFRGCGKTHRRWLCERARLSVVPIKPIKSRGL